MKQLILLLALPCFQLSSSAQIKPGPGLEELMPVVNGTVVYTDTIWESRKNLSQVVDVFLKQE